MIAAVCAKVPHVSRTFYPIKPEVQKNCAEFPHACIAKEVPTDPISPPIESVLFSHTHAPLTLFWQAPPNVASVNIIICLPFVSLVRELVLLVDAKGYTPHDAPILGVCVGHTLESVEQCLALDNQSSSSGDSRGSDVAYRVGEWAVDMEGYPPCSTLIFTFPEPRECQIVAIKFSLPTSIPDIPSLTPTQAPPGRTFGRTPSPPTTTSFSSSSSPKFTSTPELPIPYSEEFHSKLASSPAYHTDRSHPPNLQPDIPKLPQLHIGRIRIHGSFPVASSSPAFPLSLYRSSFPPTPLQLASPSRLPTSPSRNPSLRSNLASATHPTPDGWKPIAPTSDILRGRTLELTVGGAAGVKLVGIGVTVQHSGGPNSGSGAVGDGGITNQVRSLRVTALAINPKSGEISAFHNLCRILVPKTSPNATLYFHMPSVLLNVVLFEVLDSYASSYSSSSSHSYSPSHSSPYSSPNDLRSSIGGSNSDTLPCTIINLFN